MNPVQQNRMRMLNQQISNLPPDVRAGIVSAGLDDARSVLPTPMYSSIRFEATVAVNAGVSTYTFAPTPRKAFQYSIGSTAFVAGFAAGFTAAPCDTNLLRPGETLDNSDCWIWGMAAELTSGSGATSTDPKVVQDIWRDCDLQLSLNGTTSIRIGTLGMYPCAGSLYGRGSSAMVRPTLGNTGFGDGGPGQLVGPINNGNPLAGNFRRFPQPFKWAAVGNGGSDSSLSVIATLQNTLTYTATARAAVGVAPALTVEAYTPPEALIVDVRFQLICVNVSKRSVNT